MKFQKNRIKINKLPRNLPQNYKFKRRTVNFREKKYRRPFWLPASNFYILAVAATISCFFLMWGIFGESGEETPWIPAGMISSFLLVCAVFIREVILRKARQRYAVIEKQLDFQIRKVPPVANIHKLSLKQNAEIIKNIKIKSEAADVFAKLSEGHWEVFLLCNEYLILNRNELKTVGTGSPRLAALRRGREIISELHHKHLLIWAKNHTRIFTDQSKNQVKISDKMDSVEKAINTLKTALKYYPNDINLLESAEALGEYRAKIKVSHWIEQAERNAFKGNYKRAHSLYRDALFYLGRENIRTEERELIAEKINVAIAGLRNEQNDNLIS